MTADMFTDIITIDKTGRNIIIHIFDSMTSSYSEKISFQPKDCAIVSNVAVGRGPNTLRLFVTCQSFDKTTILKLYDRNMNDELVELVQSKVRHEQATAPPGPNPENSSPENIAPKNSTSKHRNSNTNSSSTL